MIMDMLCCGYESRFDVIICNQLYWNYHDFFGLGDLLSFSVPGGTEKIPVLFPGGVGTQADTMGRAIFPGGGGVGGREFFGKMKNCIISVKKLP